MFLHEKCLSHFYGKASNIDIEAKEIKINVWWNGFVTGAKIGLQPHGESPKNRQDLSKEAGIIDIKTINQIIPTVIKKILYRLLFRIGLIKTGSL